MSELLGARPQSPWPIIQEDFKNPHYANHGNQWGAQEEFSEKVENNYTIRQNLNSTLTALSASPDYSRVVIAGREVLKVLDVSQHGIVEVYNLRSRNFNKYSNDVKWGNNSTKNKIAAAAINGSIVIWDIGDGRTKTERKFEEHSRAVNRICINPVSGSTLLSASQDCTMRLWDMRDSEKAKFTFEGKCDNVRDVQFNPVNQNEFAAAFDNGAIQKWDIRKPTIHERKLSAHIGSVLAVDWHSDGRTIASGGRDKSIKIWDMNSDNRRSKDVIQSMTSIARIQWRPNKPNEIASCALLNDNRIFVWDIKRPYIASYYFEEHEDVPTGFLWHGSNQLWSCSKDKHFIQQDISNAYRQLDMLSKCGIGWSIQDEVAFAIDKPNEENKPYVPSKTMKSETRNEPQQKAGVASLHTFDVDAFSELAENYIISSHDIKSVCEHNAAIAWEFKRFRTAQTWKIIQLLYGILEPVDKNETLDEEGIDDNLLKDSSSANPSKSLGEIKEPDSIAEKTNEEDEDFEEGDVAKDPNVEEAQLPRTIKMTSNIVQTTYNSTLYRNWDKESIMMQLLDYYAEQGDVQMCVTLILVLGDRIKISQERVEQWFFSYIELLHRFQLWRAATYIISSCEIPSVKVMNQESTTIYTSCNHCFKAIHYSKHNKYWICDKCGRLLNPCSICHKIVKGLYTWCQTCSHGGHLAHMKEWFSKNKECPTGCGHKCSATLFNEL